jgi:hypothetical protein
LTNYPDPTRNEKAGPETSLFLHRHLSEYFSKTENPFALLAIAHDKLNRIDTTSHTIIYTDASKSDKGKTGISIYINPKENWHFRLSDNI